MPPSLSSNEPWREPLRAIVLTPWWGRVILVFLAGLASLVMAVAIYLDPYEPDGTPLLLETHRQLGLPECTFKMAVGVPCPSCGMTTSFAQLVRGDVLSSLRANAAGTLLAVLTLAFIPWALVSATRGHLLYIRSVERALMRVVILFLVVMLVRWGLVLLLQYA
ncbi:MAG: DUF2752 domain-containing protein [Gemmataceae bacterium]|nr:DUF2752 domain-containing protein [Gemmataceae bacterium]